MDDSSADGDGVAGRGKLFSAFRDALKQKIKDSQIAWPTSSLNSALLL